MHKKIDKLLNLVEQFIKKLEWDWRFVVNILVLIIVILLLTLIYYILIAEKGVTISFFQGSSGIWDILSSVGTFISAILVGISLLKLTKQIKVAKEANLLQTRDIQTQTIMAFLRQSNDSFAQYNKDNLESTDDFTSKEMNPKQKRYHQNYIVAQHVIINNICLFYINIMNKEDNKLYGLFDSLLIPMIRRFVNSQYDYYRKYTPNSYLFDAIIVVAVEYNKDPNRCAKKIEIYREYIRYGIFAEEWYQENNIDSKSRI